MWRFLKTEMHVILGLVEDAARTDAEIAELYGLNKGTVASIRRRLIDAGAISYRNVPAFHKLGCEMIAFSVGTTDPGVSADIKTSHYMEFCETMPQAFFAMLGGSSVMFYTALRNMTELETIIEAHEKFFVGSKRASAAKFRDTFFPFAVSKATYELNFASLVHRYFKLDVPAPKVRPLKRVEIAEPDLTEHEQHALLAMVEHPAASDREIADTVKLSRQAVTRIRHRLTDDGYFTPICIPNLYKWGFEIMVVGRACYNMDMSWEKRTRSEPRQTFEGSFFSLTKSTESVTNYMVPRFQDYSDNLEPVMAWYHKVRAFRDKPDLNLFSLERCTELRNFDYGPAVRNLLFPKQKAGRA